MAVARSVQYRKMDIKQSFITTKNKIKRNGIFPFLFLYRLSNFYQICIYYIASKLDVAALTGKKYAL